VFAFKNGGLYSVRRLVLQGTKH